MGSRGFRSSKGIRESEGVIGSKGIAIPSIRGRGVSASNHNIKRGVRHCVCNKPGAYISGVSTGRFHQIWVVGGSTFGINPGA